MKHLISQISFFLLKPGQERWPLLSKRPYYIEMAIILIASSLFGLLLSHANLKAQWGPIDDHQIWEYLGQDGHMTPGEALEHFQRSEVMTLGIVPRYRPAYFFLRLTETLIWQNNVHLWYLSRIALLCLSLWGGWIILARYIGIFPSGLLIVYVATFPSLADLFCRLGPAETYATPATILYMWAFLKILNYRITKADDKHRPNNTRAWIALCFAFVCAAGSKENFLILVPGTWLLWVLINAKHARTRTGDITCLLITALGVIQGTLLCATISRCNEFVYDQDASSSAIFQQVADLPAAAVSHHELFLLPCSTLFICALVFRRRSRASSTISTSIKTLLIVAMIALVTFGVQYLFYSGYWPNGNRYDYPYMLIIPLIYATSYMILLRSFPDNKALNINIIAFVVLSLCATAVAGKVLQKNLPIRWAAITNAHRTTIFTTKMEQLKEDAQASPSATIWVISHQARDYEPIVAIHRYTDLNNITNTMKVLTLHAMDSSGDFIPNLGSKTRDVSVEGKHGYMSGTWTTNDISHEDILIQLSGNTPIHGINYGRIW